jgi:hypothetical protein
MKTVAEMDIWNQPDEGDPLDWLYKLREKTHEQYPTPEARRELYRSTSQEDLHDFIEKRMEEKLAKGYQPNDLYIPEDDK